MMERMRTVVYLFYLFEAGLFLLLVPWSQLWESNFFVVQSSFVRSVCLNPFARGVVSGIGFLHLLVGALDSLEFIRAEKG